MSEYTCVNLKEIREAEREALIGAAIDGAAVEYMRGIIDFVRMIEEKLAKEEKENDA